MLNGMMTEANALKISQVAQGQAKLDDTLQIEDALLTVLAAEKKIEHCKALKQRRVAAIEEEIQKQQQVVDNLRGAIQACMESAGEKTIDFPGVAKCTVSKKKGTWKISDEEALERDLAQRGLLDSVSELSRKFVKKDLNKLLDDLDKNRNLPKSVEREAEKVSLSVSFADDAASRAVGVEISTPAVVAVPVAAPVAAPVASPSPKKAESSSSFKTIEI